jgi:hypothetical protein
LSHPIQLALLVLPQEGRAVALVILVAFFLLVIAAVPFEFNFYNAVKRQRLLPSIAAEISVFIIMTLLLAGVMLDWFFSIKGLWLLIVLLALLMTLLLYFLYWRMRLISSLFARAGRMEKADLDKLFEALRMAAEEKKRGGKDERGGGGNA